MISKKCGEFGLKCHILQLLQPLATSKAWAHSGFSVSRQLAGEHFKQTSMFCNPHKAWISYRFHDQLLFQSSTSSLRTAGDRSAVSWRSSPNVTSQQSCRNVASVKFSTATPKALQAKGLEQTGGDMRIYDSSASASFATIDVKSQVITSDRVCLTFASKIRKPYVV